ncbi:MAG TPA: Zn-dependent hydrolase [Stellaceae bacterium]|nr:Zn-dependent hydrolase [Stellaceae bacterium]
MADPVIDAAAFHGMMTELSAIGATAGGGVHRLAASPEDGAARDWLSRRLTAAGFGVVVDPVGNLFGILDLAGPDAPVVLSGSHLDSQPLGGRFDGAYGVVAACEAAAAIGRMVQQGGVPRPACNLAVVSWTNEEGARFQPSLLGSSVYAGQMALADGLACVDGDGVDLGSALRSIGYRGEGAAPRRLAAYVEFHVECGPNLEAAGQRIGVMTGWWGAIKLQVSFIGAQSHTGPTPMARRRDALYAASLLIAEIRSLADRQNGADQQANEELYTSVGRIEVEPNSPNVVPGRVTVFIELRSPKRAVLQQACAAAERYIEIAAARAGVAARIDRRSDRLAGDFDPGLIALAEELARARGHQPMRMATIAGHDAIPLSSLCPSVVVVTPSVGGMCHHEAEYTAPEDLEEGTQLLASMLWRLCREGGAAGGRPDA